MNTHTVYVAGFLFGPVPRHNYVALIRKNKPDWQKGKLNGIGGRVEPYETPHEAMVREFNEEAGLWVRDWELFCSVFYPETLVKVHFFKAFLNHEDDARRIFSRTDEVVNWYYMPWLYCDEPMIPNLKWLLPMALSGDVGRIELMGNPAKIMNEETSHGL